MKVLVFEAGHHFVSKDCCLFHSSAEKHRFCRSLVQVFRACFGTVPVKCWLSPLLPLQNRCRPAARSHIFTRLDALCVQCRVLLIFIQMLSRELPNIRVSRLVPLLRGHHTSLFQSFAYPMWKYLMLGATWILIYCLLVILAFCRCVLEVYIKRQDDSLPSRLQLNLYKSILNSS